MSVWWAVALVYGLGALFAGLTILSPTTNYGFGEGAALILFWPLWFLKALWSGCVKLWKAT